jgi:hypothetical protein
VRLRNFPIHCYKAASLPGCENPTPRLTSRMGCNKISHIADRQWLSLVNIDPKGIKTRKTRYTPNPGAFLVGYVLHLYKLSPHGGPVVILRQIQHGFGVCPYYSVPLLFCILRQQVFGVRKCRFPNELAPNGVCFLPC